MSIASRITSIEGHISDIYDSVELTGVDTTDIDKNLVNVPNTLKEGYIDIINNGTDTLYNNFPKVSGEGTSLTLNNTYQAPMRNNLKGNTSQTGTPTPTSPIPVNVVSGDNEIIVNNANFLKLNDIAETTKNGVTYSCTNGILKLSGTTTNAILIDFELIYLPAGTYYLSRNSSGTSTGSWQNYLRNSSSQIKQGSGSFTTTIGQNVFFRVYANSGVVFNNYVLKPSITLGTTAPTDFEPYQGNTYNIDLPVENLVNRTTCNENTTLTWVAGENYNQTGSITTDYIVAKGGEIFSTSYRANVFVYDTNKTYLGNMNGNGDLITSTGTDFSTFTLPSNSSIAYIRLAYRTSANIGVDLLTANLQLERGSKINSFTPYGTTPIELCKIGNYQDYFYKDNGSWYLHKEIGKHNLTSCSYRNSSLSTNTKAFCSFLLPNKDKTHSNGTIDLGLSNNFSYKSGNASDVVSNNDNGLWWEGTSDYNYLLITLTDASTLAKVNEWLSANSTYVYYVLATPTNTEITDTTLINQLEEFYIAKSKENQTNISQINNDLPFIISASALKKGV